MRKNTIRIDNRESAILTAELTYLGYNVENVFLEAGDFEGKRIIGEIKREKDFCQSIVDQRIYYQPEKLLRTRKQCFWILELALHPEITLIPVPNTEAAIAYAIHTIIQKKDK